MLILGKSCNVAKIVRKNICKAAGNIERRVVRFEMNIASESLKTRGFEIPIILTAKMGFYLVLPLKGGETLQINERTSSQYYISHVQIVSVTLCHRKEITQSFRINEKKSEPSLLLCTGMTFTLIHTFPYIRRDSRN